MRRSRPPRPKERKTGNHQYPRGNSPPSRKTANASPQASETAVNQAAETTLRRPQKRVEESGPEPRDKEDRRTSRPTRRGYRRLKRRPSHLPPGETPRRWRSGQHPPHPKVEADDDELQTGEAHPLQKTATPQDEASGQNPRKSHQYAHLQAHAWNGKEKCQLGHPQTNLWKSDSASPDDAKSCQKKETFLWSALSTSVGPITRRPTATPARAGTP